MKIIITGKNIGISDYLKEITQKKVGKLQRYLKEDTEVQVSLCVEKNRHICEVAIPFVGAVIRAKEVTGDMYASVDNVIDKLEKQIIKHRTRLEKRLREDAFIGAQVDESALPHMRRIVRTKRFALKPMSTQEAVEQMELLGHSFFVFNNATTDEVNVLYLRDDGDLGLIEPGDD